MSRLVLNNVAAPSTPASGKVALFSDSATPGKILRQIDDTGKILTVGPITNFSSTSQAPATATRVYIAGSALSVPSGKLQIGTHFFWRFNLTKTGAGIATSTLDIAVGTAGTTADTARVSFTKPAGTGVIDEGIIEIGAVCRGPLSASGVFSGEMYMTHNLATTGHMAQQCFVANTISGAFDVTVASLIIGLCITSGAADVVTIQQIQSYAWNM